MDTRITALDAASFRDYLPEALAVYVAAMGYPAQVMRSRAPAWSEHSRREGWHCVAALAAPRRRMFPAGRPPLMGVCYGYRGRPGQWWFNEVDRGLREHCGRALDDDYVELTELHVSPPLQGRGVGGAMLREFLSSRTEARVLLSTPEVPNEDNGAWRLYRGLGFVDVLRDFRFTGDQRPFAVLGRSLPLPDADAPAASATHRGDSGTSNVRSTPRS